MWMFTPVGFFSIIYDPKGTKAGAPEAGKEPPKPRGDDLLWVRARVRKDLERLKEKYLPGGYTSPILEIPGRDYPYRISVFRENWKAAVARMINDLTYTNFKDEVTRVDSPERHDLYSRVWSDMYGAEGKLKQIRADNARWARKFDKKYAPAKGKGKKGKKGKDDKQLPLSTFETLAKMGEPSDEEIAFAFRQGAEVVDFAAAKAERKAAKERRKARKAARGATIEVGQGSEGGPVDPDALATDLLAAAPAQSGEPTYGTADACPCPYCASVIINLWDKHGDVRVGDAILCEECYRTAIVDVTEHEGPDLLVKLVCIPTAPSAPTPV